MSARSLRRALVGFLFTVVLSLASPVRCESLELPEARLFWLQTWHWLMDCVAPATEEAASGESAADRGGSDAGWTLDPNG